MYENDVEPQYPGEFLGMPETGSGSQASVMRRMGAVAIDWLICLGAATLIVAQTDALGDKATLTYLLWLVMGCLLYTSPSPRDRQKSRMPSSA